MEKHIKDERTGISYTLQGDYYLPDLILPNQDFTNVGMWGRRHYSWLQQNKPHIYNSLLWTERLPEYLESIDKAAEDMYENLISAYAKAENISQQLKAENQLEWVRQMNNISARARETVNAELICR